MVCPSCGSENPDGAVACGLCSIVLAAAETPPSLPAQEPEGGEPRTLDSAAARESLIELAYAKVEADEFGEALRLTRRLFKEAPRADAAAIVAAAGETWLSGESLPPELEGALRARLGQAVGALSAGDLVDSSKTLQAFAGTAEPEPGAGLRFFLLVAGVKATAADGARSKPV